jgi:cell division protein FtsI (penicillin-binding protein 3)
MTQPPPPGGPPLPPTLPPPVPTDASPVLPARAAVRRTPPRPADNKQIRTRLGIATLGFAILFGAVAVRLAEKTVINPASSAIAQGRPLPRAEPPVTRAEIVDRNNEVLAVTVRGTALYARPALIQDPQAVAALLHPILPHLDRERLVARLSPPYVFAYIDRFITPRQEAAINALGIVGLNFETAERRTYPRGRDAAHVLGLVDVDNQGLFGAERWFDERLRVDRTPLRLSLDIRIQRELRETLAHTIERFSGIGGVAMLMDVNNGEMLGMASLPDFSGADPAASPPGNRFHRAVEGVYEPGSTMKLVTAAMALELGTVQMHSGFDASRSIQFGRHSISDFRGKNRWLALPEIIAYSSNIASAHMAMTAGPARHREFLARMGIARHQRLGIELPESAAILLPGERDWRDIHTMTIGFGHGVSITPLHVINSAATLANGGLFRVPTILAQPPGVEREGTRVISERTSAQMRRLMRIAVTEGSARGANAPGYFVGGKTGTALKPNPGGRGYSTDRRVSAFVGAFPMHAPRYAIYIMVDEPRPRADTGPYATAGVVAAPAARRVIERVAPILGLVPEIERMAEIEQALHVPLQPGRPPASPIAAPRPPSQGRAPDGAAPAIAPGPPPMQPQVAPIRRTSGPAPSLQTAESRHASP